MELTERYTFSSDVHIEREAVNYRLFLFIMA